MKLGRGGKDSDCERAGVEMKHARMVSAILSLVAVLLVLVLAGAPAAQGDGNCARSSVGFVPLTDLGAGTYQGFAGGLYPNGLNRPPDSYLQAGMAAAQMIQPLNSGGQPDPRGKIVLLSIGMSNTAIEFGAFKGLADGGPQKNPQVVIVNGAQGGADARVVARPDSPYWRWVQDRLDAAQVTAQQVQVVWLKEAIAGERSSFPVDAKRLQEALRAIVQILGQQFPNLRIVYLSNRTYGGYATTRLNPEPVAYESSFAVKWVIEDRINGTLRGPWLAWGPYLWTDATKGRLDGFIWECQDVRADGTHPSPSGVQKVARLLLDFFKTDPTAALWFRVQ